MVFPVVLLKLVEWVLFYLLAKPCYRAVRKMKTYGFLLKNLSLRLTSQQPSPFPSLAKCGLDDFRYSSATIVCDIDGGLLKTQSFFPYFMLVAFEGGSPIRALFLLLSWPFICLLDYQIQLRIMIFITFCGLKVKNMETVARAVLPKFYLENLHLKVYRVLTSSNSSIVFTSIPNVMVEWFLKHYLNINHVVGTELHCYGSYFTGFLKDSTLLVKHKALQNHLKEGGSADLGLGNELHRDHHLLLSLCKEAYVVTKEDNKTTTPLSPEKYPKPLVFHDGRLAFLPTPLATAAMFLWLPFGIILAIFRISLGILFPYKMSVVLGVFSGIDLRVNGIETLKGESQKGVLYVCNHRTLMDPVFLATGLGKPLSAVTYSLSKVSEIMSPIKTVRLTRDRKTDAETMHKMLREGDLVVCPEGTTCREPYLLRFSSLFAEISEEIVPVAINTTVDMFYGTTASGWKWLDPIFFLMNPRPCYDLHILEQLPKELTCAGGWSGHEVANYLQRKLADVLGFQCTNLTRKEKYLMLAGNEGLVRG